MRKLITTGLIAVLAIVMGAASVQAQNPTSGDFGSLKWKYDTGTKTLTISGQGEMPNYDWQGMPWVDFEETMTKVVIENGVTKIGDFAFYRAKELISVKFPASGLTQIGENAFGYCQKLELSVLPEGLIRIGRSAFTDCDKLSLVTFPESLEEIGEQGFFQCRNLLSVTISAGIKKIGAAAFSGCRNLEAVTVDGRNTEYVSENGVLFDKNKTVLMLHPAKRPWTKYDIPSSIKKIDKGAFNGCYNLTTVTIPNGLTSIEERAFTYCSYLSSLAIPASVTNIAEGAIFGCWYFEGCTVAPENNHYKSVNGVLFNHDQTTLLVYPKNHGVTEYVIPAGVKRIGELAFFSNDDLTSVKFPAGLKEIGEWAFQNTKLTSVSLPAGFTKISGQAFRNCPNLTSVRLPAEVTEIGLSAFTGCKNLKKLTVKMETPPDIQYNEPFEGDLSKIILSVPTGKKANYENKAVWRDFNIVDTEEPFEVLFPSPDMTYEARLHTIDITSERPWRASIEGEGAVFEKRIDPKNVEQVLAIEGEGDQTLALSVFENPGTDERTIKVKVETTDDPTNKITKEVTIKQKGWYGVKIGDVGLTSENYNDITASKGFTAVKSGTVTYDKDENVLTLENAEIESWRIGVYFSQGGTIVLKGNNKITATQESVPAIAQNRVVPLRFKGDGSLTVSANLNHGISGVGDVIIEGGCSVEVMPSIRTNNGKVIIDDAELYVKSRADFYSTIIAAKGIELKGDVKVLEPKAAEIKQYDAEYDSQGNWYKFYSFLQGNTPCKEVRIGHEVKLEAKAVKDEPVSIDGGEKQINVTSDAKWKVTVPAEAAAWVEVKGKTAGTNPNDSLVTLTVKPNLTLGTPREATILFETVAEKGLPAKQEVKITQEGSNFLAHWVSMYDTTLHFTAKKDTLKMKITSNTDWEISVPNPGEWLRIVKDGAANGDFKLEGKLAAKDTVIKFITIANNDEYGFREAKITIKTKDGRFTQEFIAVQDGKFRIKLPEKKTLDLDHVPANKETVQTFEIRSEEPWTLDISTLTNLRTKHLFNGLPWLTVETSPLTGGGAHDSIVKVTIATNTAVAARGAKLEFMNANGTSMGKFNLKQDASTPAPTPSTPSTPSNQGTTRPTTPVIVSITGITLDKTEIVVDGNAKSLWLTTLISPTDATNKVIKWTSSDSAVASVSDRGLVTIHKKGKAVITATTTDGSGKSATCNILVRSTVANATLPEARIYAAGGRLYLTLQTAAPVGIYTLNGVLVRTFSAPAGETTVALPQGVYIVRVGERTEKVFIN